MVWPRAGSAHLAVGGAGLLGASGGASSSGRGDADGAYASREDASRGWYDRRNSAGGAAAARSKPLRPLSRQGATLLACLNVSPDLFDEAVDKQVIGPRMPQFG